MRFNYNDNIPTLNLEDFTGDDAAKRLQFVKDLGQIYSEIGFVAITNHGFESSKQKDLYESVEQFFKLEDDVKNKYDGSYSGGQRGYTGKRKEHAAGRSMGDLKEFYHVGKEIEGNESDHYQKNIIPKE